MNTLPAKITPQVSATEITPAQLALIANIRTEIEQGKERALIAMEQEKKVMYWNIGKHIKEHLLKNSDRAEYGSTLFEHLVDNLQISKTLLYRSLQFFEEYPNIFQAPGKLTWTHYIVLLAIQDKQLRQTYEEKVLTENLSSRDLQELIKQSKQLPEQPTTPEKPPPILPLERGIPYVYKIITLQNQAMVDLGFRYYSERDVAKETDQTVVQVVKKNNRYSFIKSVSISEPHYTYKACLREVVDGDTIWVDIDLGFCSWTKQKLRLRGINAPEMETPQGIASREYVANRLKGCKFIAIKTYWRDKFNRYLADVFYNKREQDLCELARNGKFLNQELLDEGMAVRYE